MNDSFLQSSDIKLDSNYTDKDYLITDYSSISIFIKKRYFILRIRVKFFICLSKAYKRK